MIVSSTKAVQGLNDISYKDEQVVFTHAQDVAPILQEAQISRNCGNEGWDKGKKSDAWQRIGIVPGWAYVKYPEMNRDARLSRKWLLTEEGSPYRTTRGRI